MGRRGLLIIFGLAAGCASPTRIAQTPAEGQPVLAVMTFNVNYGLAADPSTLAAIRARNVDVILLQETNEAWEQAIRAELSERYPFMHFVHCCGAGGLAVLSKAEITEVEVLEAKTWFPALRLVVNTPLGEVQMLNVHLRPPFDDQGSVVFGYFTTPKIRRREIAAFAARLQRDQPTLVAGDFNEGESGAAVQLLEGQGFVSALPEFDPGADTWRWQTSVGEVHSRLDHVIYNRRLVPLNTEVVMAGRSDHLPVVARFARSD